MEQNEWGNNGKSKLGWGQKAFQRQIEGLEVAILANCLYVEMVRALAVFTSVSEGSWGGNHRKEQGK